MASALSVLQRTLRTLLGAGLLALAALKIADARSLADSWPAMLMTGVEVGLGLWLMMATASRMPLRATAALGLGFLAWQLLAGPADDGRSSCGCFGHLRPDYVQHLCVSALISAWASVLLASAPTADGRKARSGPGDENLGRLQPP